MSEFRFAHPWAFVLLLLGTWIVWRHWWRAKDATALYSDLGLMRGLPLNWRARLAPLPDVLRVVGWCLLVIALARPQSGQSREVIRGQGIDIVFALDISGSMAALDFQPDNRLAVAKSVIMDFVEGREYDRLGVVVYARNAYHLVPLTLDYHVLNALLKDVKLVTRLVDPSGAQTSLDGTALGTGIAAAAAMMRNSPARSKVIVLLTDGATNAGLDPVTAAEAAATLGIKTYAIGIGRPGEVPFEENDGTITTIVSDLDEPALQRVVEAGSGQYFRATDAESLGQIAAQIDRLERSPVQRQVIIPWRDQVECWLIFGVIALFLERALRHTLLATAP
ncbi:MAG: VWA domain-containing protein [Chloroflexi bacterium]|nr:VWA domain-containing protein [Chloroflexota bacterium]